MVTLAICDDDPIHLKYTASLVQKELLSSELSLALYSAPKGLLASIREGSYCPDIVILDIELGQENGIQVAREINIALPSCSIIFLTGHPNYAPACYETKHVWFVLKESAEEYLGQALRRAIASSENDSSVIELHVKSGGKRFSLLLGSVLYLDSVARKTQIVCTDTVYTVPGRPSDLLSANKAASPYFIRCHQGYWVNLRHVHALEKNEVVLTDGSRIPISRSYREEARRQFFQRFQSVPSI